MSRKEFLHEIECINETTKSLKLLHCIRDADAVFADIVSKVDFKETGIFEELVSIYKSTEDEQSFKSLFKLFTGHSFERFLEECKLAIKSEFYDEDGVDKGHKILSEAEFEGLSKIANKNKLEWFAIVQFENKDYIVDCEEGEIVPFESGLEWLNESIYQEHPDYQKDYDMTEEESKAVTDLFAEEN